MTPSTGTGSVLVSALDDIEWQRIGMHRGPGLKMKSLPFRGDGRGNNLWLSLSEMEDGWYSPRHMHNFDQVRYVLAGETGFTKWDLHAGECAYFPAGVSYGPKSSTAVLLNKKGAQMFLDTDKAIQSIRTRAAITENAAVRRNLEVVIKHMETERDRDLEACMETVSENAVYYQWGGPDKVQPRGREQVRAAYTAAFKERRGAYLQYDIDRIVADEWAVTTDGMRRSVFPGAVISASDGWPVSNYPVDDPNQLYLVTERQMTVWPFDDKGLLSGEEFYRVVTDVRPLEPHEAAEVPEN